MRLKIQKPWAIAFPRNENIHATNHNNRPRRARNRQTDEMTNAKPKTKTTVNSFFFLCKNVILIIWFEFLYHFSVRIAGAPDYAQLTWCPFKNFIVFIFLTSFLSCIMHECCVFHEPDEQHRMNTIICRTEGSVVDSRPEVGGHPAAGTGGESLEKIAAVVMSTTKSCVKQISPPLLSRPLSRVKRISFQSSASSCSFPQRRLSFSG